MKLEQVKYRSRPIIFFTILFFVIVISNLISISILAKSNNLIAVVLLAFLLLCLLLLFFVSKNIYYSSKLFVSQIKAFATACFSIHNKNSNAQEIQIDELLPKFSEAFKIWLEEINSRNQAEIDLKESELKYRNLLEISRDLVWQCDLNGCYTYLNPAWERIMGYKMEEMLGRSFGDFVNKTQAKIDLETYNNVLKGADIFGYKTIFISKSGSNIYLEINARIQKNTKGQVIGTHGTASDIASRINVEDELSRRKEKYSRLATASIEGVAYFYKSRIQKTNKQFAKIFGYTPDELLDKHWEELVVTDDHDMIIYNAEIAEDQLYEFRGIRKDGSIIYVEVKDISMSLEGNNYWLTIIRHVAERKDTEIFVRKLNTAIEQSANCIIITDPSGNIEYINKKLTELTGYSSSEVIGKNIDIMQSGKHAEEFYCEMWATLHNKKEWSGDIYN